MAGDIFTSEVINESIVAILGLIIPLPLAIPPIVHFLPSIVNSTATDFGIVSVVIIAAAASSEPS